MAEVHPTAIIHPEASIASDVTVGPWSVIGAEVTIGSGTEIASHVVIKGPTTIGEKNKIYQFSSVGEDTPDLKYNGEPTTLVIGDNNIIREGVTLHRGTVQDRGETRVGDHNLLMAYVHVGHDSVIGDHCILVNNSALAGHVTVGDYAILGGFTLVHQFTHVGIHSFTGMGSAVGKDIPAYVMVTGAPAAARNINLEGLKRRGYTKEQLSALTDAYRTLYRKGLTLEAAIEQLEEKTECVDVLAPLINSLKSSSRGIVR